MKPANRPYQLVILPVLILLTVSLYGQRADTAYLGGKVVILDHGLHVYDSSEFRAMQWGRQRRPAAPTPVALMATSAFGNTQAIKLPAARPLSGSRAHTLNACGVTAAISPGDDSIELTSQQLGPFTNASINATSVSWYLNGVIAGNSPTLNLGYQIPGLYEITLVAQNGACADTATCYYYITGTQPANRDNIKAYYGMTADQHINDLAAVPGGGYLLGGYGYSLNNYFFDTSPQGMLVKISESGCIEWTKKIPSVSQAQLYKVLALRNGGYACSGYNDVNSYVMMLDALGNTLWTKTYYVGGESFLPQWIAEPASGGLVLAGTKGTNNISVIRTDVSGNVLWTRSYEYNSPQTTAYDITGMLAQGSDICVTGVVYPNYLGPTAFSVGYTFIADLNDAAGTTNWTRQYSLNGTYVIPRSIEAFGGNLLFNSSGGSTVPNFNNTINFLDASGIPVQSTTLSIPGINYAVEHSTVLPLPSGQFYVLNSGTETLPLYPGYAYHTLFMKLDAGLNPLWSYEYGHVGGGKYFNAAIGLNNTLAAAGDELGNSLVPWSTYSFKMMFKKMNDAAANGTFNASCDFFNFPVTRTPETLGSQLFGWTSETTPAATASDTALNAYTVYAQVRYECPEFVDSCSFLKLTGTTGVCDLSGNYTYRAHRNSACGEPIQWDLPSNVSLVGQTDSTVTLKFPSFGNYRIASALPYACSPMKDSLFVTAASRTAPLNLGNDTTLCPNSSFILHAGPHFLRYVWQDGSVDSTYTVSGPGTYYIEVADSCDNLLHDTVVVSPYHVAVDVGPDRTKCNADTIHLNAPPGFLSYNWTPNYNISANSAQQVVINPTIDTSYVLRAEKIPGCFGYDTVHITVNHSPPIRLGADTSLCTGDSLVINAGGGFSKYVWNTGAVTQRTTAYNRGSYSVTGTAGDGCISADTLRILNLWPLPSINLDHNPGICIGEPRQLAATPGNSYLWNNGSTSSSIVITDTGNYSVVVTDRNGCQNRDSVSVTAFLSIPAGFLTGDTSVCSYGKLEIVPLEKFQSYLWSTGSTSESITVAKPGVYWLEATDSNYCVGRDTIDVAKKDCMEGFYIPNAFTPSGPSNIQFRPLLFGNILQYEFSIYNRWGQLIFQNNQPGAGWDGNYRGNPEAAGVYVWYCRYVLDGQPEQVRRGTVVLIR